MAKFKIVTNPEKKYIDQAWIITDEYFTIDTAERDVVDTWYEKNASTIIYALTNEEVAGFFTIVPLTSECTELFAHNEIREEDLTEEHILPPEANIYAKSMYVAAIAIKDKQSITGKFCVAALVAALCNRIRTLYSEKHLQYIFVNPTTFDGNRFIHKLGFERVNPIKKSMRAGNDIYALQFDDQSMERLRQIEERYSRFISETNYGS